MPRDAVSRTANVERNGGHKWVKLPKFQQSDEIGATTLWVSSPPQRQGTRLKASTDPFHRYESMEEARGRPNLCPPMPDSSDPKKVTNITIGL